MLKAMGVGRLGADAEMRSLDDGTPVLNWRMAFNGPKKNADPTWVSCALFGKRAEALEPYMVKGAQFGVSGTLSEREYKTKDGEMRKTLELRVDDVAFCGDAPAREEPRGRQREEPRGRQREEPRGRQREEPRGRSGPGKSSRRDEEEGYDKDIPF
jgi:single-strand DNA-binding protein